MLVDALGLLLVVVVQAANIRESEGAKLVRRARGRCLRLRLIGADQGAKAHRVAWAKAVGGWAGERVTRPAGATGFRVLPRRWAGERTRAWPGRARRLSKDFEGGPRPARRGARWR